MVRKSVLIVGILILFVGAALSSGCVNEKNQPVDWFVSLRVPNSRQYLIYQSNQNTFRQTDESLLEMMVSKLSWDKGGLLMWNDQTVNGDGPTSTAHSKGILHWEETNGFLFVHSIPQFAETNGKTVSGSTRTTSNYGQSIVCFTLNSRAQADKIIEHLVAQKSNFYEDTFGVGKVKKGSYSEYIQNKELPFGFEMVTKTYGHTVHPFEGMLTSAFKVGWLANTWGRPYMGSSCDASNKISNIKLKNLGGVVMKDTQDHSKWALSYGDKRRLVCIGDLNHMESQKNRGGSFICRDDPVLYKAMFSLILDDECQISKNFEP